MKCLKNKATHTYSIYGRGWGSDFDGFDTHFQLCDDCHKEEYNVWANETNEWCDEYSSEEYYTHEGDIENLIKSFPLEGQELFCNTFASGSSTHGVMLSQDWIDYKLGELSHEKCKEYGLYSPEEISAYNERFPNCSCVVIREYQDGSKGSCCPKGAFGDTNGNICRNVSDKCYMCDSYKPRSGDIKIVNDVQAFYENEKSRLIEILQDVSTRLKELEDDVQEYMYKYE
jgi:hypothetical protein